MIQLEKITIHDFRGIRDLPLDLGRKNFAVCGPNGTGKSGVVDAVEFVLTGTISRLTGKGRGDLSVKEHGPHVGSRANQAYVECVLYAPSLSRQITIKRTIGKPYAPEVTPDTPFVRDLIGRLEDHPELALSRRQIIKYVLTEPGQRAKDIQALLKLDELEEARTRLQKIANAEDAAAHVAERAELDAGQALMRAMTIAQPTPPEILVAANARRAILGLKSLTDLTNEASLRDGIATRASGEAGPSPNKAAATADAASVIAALAARDSDDFARRIEAAKTAIEALRADASLLEAVEREDLLTTALELYDGEACPVCDTEFRPEEFAAVIARKQAKLTEVKRLRAAAETCLAPIIKDLEDEVAALRSIYPHARLLLAADDLGVLVKCGRDLTSWGRHLVDLLPLDEALTALDSAAGNRDASPIAERLRTAVAALPEPSALEAATVYLTIAQERLATLRGASATHRAAKARAATARRVFDIYADSTTKALEQIYQDVQSSFAELYRELNSDDESTFQAKLIPSIGKLGFNVDFYGKGLFPPGAFHSEGHQDSMGLCLYLALMKYLLGDKFTIAVLDDVVMSVDAGHRREISRMLKTKFPGTQFILTTHDKAWLKQLTVAGLVESKRVAHFRKWTVDDGPSLWGDADVWSEIEAYLVADDVRAAAALLRHTLEHTMAEQCQALRAKVEFSVEGRHDLGDLLQPAINQLKALLADAVTAAESWGEPARARVDRLRARQSAFADAAKAALGEQWQLNSAIHHNAWANLHVNDFRPLVTAFKTLADQFICTTCQAPLEISPGRGAKEYLQCSCGAESFAFKKKPKDSSAASAA